MMYRFFFLYFCLFALPPFGYATFYHELSTLEQSMVNEGLQLYQLKPDENPTGKVVRRIYIITGSPFTDDSGFLTLLNRLHINTKEHIVRRELFQKEGELFDEAAIRDSEMVLRSQDQVRSLSVIVPVWPKAHASKHEVDLLVATRDLLSLRPTFNFKGSLGTLTNLMVALGEDNLFGYNKSIVGVYEWQQSGHIFSARYFDPRMLGSRFQFTIRPTLIFAHDFKFDGFLGDLRAERPLLSERDRFGYGIDISYGNRSIIDFNGGKVRTFSVPTINGIETYERKYRWRNGKGSLFGRLSFGTLYKNEVFFSYNLNVKRPSIINESSLSASLIEHYKKHILPRDELESYITLGFSHFSNKFLTLYDYDNYKLQETKRIGPSITIANDFASKTIFSDNNFLRPEVKLSFMQPLNQDSFFNLSVSASTRYDGDFTDNINKYGFTIISPKLYGLGRAILDGRLSMLYKNRDNQKFILGSDSGIRGVESRFYDGTKGFRTNLELRSAPVALWIFHAGLALFYDVGAAFDQWQKANPTHALGFGFRFLAPQVSALPFRIDLAFPIYGPGQKSHVIVPSFGTGQAF